MTERRNLRVVPGAEPSPPPPSWSPPQPLARCVVPPCPSIAVLQARDDAPVGVFVLQLVRALREHGETALLLWSERVETLPDGVFTVGESSALFSDALRPAAEAAHHARIAHLGARAEEAAVGALLTDPGPATCIVVDGRLMGVLKPHRSVVVEGEGPVQWRPEAEALRERVETELVDPGPVAAAAVVRALQRLKPKA